MSSDTDYGAGWDAGYASGFEDGLTRDDHPITELSEQQTACLSDLRAWFLNYNREQARKRTA